MLRKPAASLILMAVMASIAAAAEFTFQTPKTKAELEAVIQKEAGSVKGVLGVWIKHVESGEIVTLNGSRRFQLASVFKIPVLLTLFKGIDQGRFSLDDRIVLETRMKTYGSGLLADMKPGLNLSIQDLQLLMMARSDNTATDILYDLVTPEAIRATMAELGLKSTTIDMNTRQLILAFLGLDPARSLTIEELARVPAATWAAAEVRERRLAFAASEHNTSTPAEIGLLLEKCVKGEIVSRTVSDQILETLKVHTGAELITRYLPYGTPIARKGGSLAYGEGDVVLNDSGIVWLPGDAGHLVICLFGNDLREVHYEIKDKMGTIARAAYDYFLDKAKKPAKG